MLCIGGEGLFALSVTQSKGVLWENVTERDDGGVCDSKMEIFAWYNYWTAPVTKFKKDRNI